MAARFIFHLGDSATPPAVHSEPLTSGRRRRVDILTATKDFEKWLYRHTRVVKSQLSDKHRQMAESPVQFLRGTLYRWTQLFPEICPDLRKAPVVLSVGDLHIASFGPGREGFGRLSWGAAHLTE